MPQWDMGWDELQKYDGRTPKPADFDDYWTRAFADLDSQAADVKIVEIDLGLRSADCFDLTFTGVGGAQVYAKYLRPKDSSGRAVAAFDGYYWHSPDWFELLSYAAEGFSVLAMDCRGQGGRSLDTGGPHQTTNNGHIVRGLLEGPDFRPVIPLGLATARAGNLVRS